MSDRHDAGTGPGWLFPILRGNPRVRRPYHGLHRRKGGELGLISLTPETACEWLGAMNHREGRGAMLPRVKGFERHSPRIEVLAPPPDNTSGEAIRVYRELEARILDDGRAAGDGGRSVRANGWVWAGPETCVRARTWAQPVTHWTAWFHADDVVLGALDFEGIPAGRTPAFTRSDVLTYLVWTAPPAEARAHFGALAANDPNRALGLIERGGPSETFGQARDLSDLLRPFDLSGLLTSSEADFRARALAGLGRLGGGQAPRSPERVRHTGTPQ